MKHMIKHLAIVVLVIALAAAGYMAYQHCYGAREDNVKVQLLNFGPSGNYDQGYRDGMRDANN